MSISQYLEAFLHQKDTLSHDERRLIIEITHRLCSRPRPPMLAAGSCSSAAKATDLFFECYEHVFKILGI